MLLTVFYKFFHLNASIPLSEYVTFTLLYPGIRITSEKKLNPTRICSFLAEGAVVVETVDTVVRGRQLVDLHLGSTLCL